MKHKSAAVKSCVHPWQREVFFVTNIVLKLVFALPDMQTFLLQQFCMHNLIIFLRNSIEHRIINATRPAA